MNIHNIAYLKKYFWSYGFPKLPIWGFGQIYEHGLEALPAKPTTFIKARRKAKNPYLSRYGEMDREVKVAILHVKILLYHWSDPVYDEGSIETYEKVCAWGRFIYRPWWFSFYDTEEDNHMDER